MIIIVYGDPLDYVLVWLLGMTPLFTRLNPKIEVFFSSNAHVSFISVISLLLVDILYVLSCFCIIETVVLNLHLVFCLLPYRIHLNSSLHICIVFNFRTKSMISAASIIFLLRFSPTTKSVIFTSR